MAGEILIYNSQFYFVRFPVLVESKDIYQKFHSPDNGYVKLCKMKQTLSCYVIVKGSISITLLTQYTFTCQYTYQLHQNREKMKIETC